MVRIESGESSFLLRVSSKIKLFMPGRLAKKASISTQPPFSKLVRVGILLKKAFKSSPTTNPAPQVFPMSKREVPLFPDAALLARERGARSSRERPAVTLLTLLRVGGLGLRPRHACNRPPPDLRPAAGRKKEPIGSFPFYHP